MEELGDVTWATEVVGMWLNNEEPYYDELQAILGTNDDDEDAADELKNFVTDIFGDFGKFGDITLTSELEDVNWLLIVEMERYE